MGCKNERNKGGSNFELSKSTKETQQNRERHWDHKTTSLQAHPNKCSKLHFIFFSKKNKIDEKILESKKTLLLYCLSISHQ